MTKSKNRIILYICIGLAALLIIGGVIVFGGADSAAVPAELLSLGEQFLLDLDYENALVQFLGVIEIEPMNERAYTGAAEAYIGLGQTEDAIAILEQGLAVLPESAAITAMLEQLRPPPTEPATEPSSETEPETEPAPDRSENLRDLSPDFFGQLAIRNLEYELSPGDPQNNNAEGFLGYTRINFDLDLTSLPQELSQRIKGYGIWEWQESPFTEDEAIYNCMYSTRVWGEQGFRNAEPVTGCNGGFPTYEDDVGKQYQVCFVLTDSDGSAIGYCLADIIIPESGVQPQQTAVIPDDIAALFSRLESAI